MALGTRIKVVILNILPASTRNELKFSLKIAFMFLAIILKWQDSNGDIFPVIRKKVTVLAGPWSANVVLGPRVTKTSRKVFVNLHENENFSKFYSFFIFLDISKPQSR